MTALTGVRNQVFLFRCHDPWKWKPWHARARLRHMEADVICAYYIIGLKFIPLFN